MFKNKLAVAIILFDALILAGCGAQDWAQSHLNSSPATGVPKADFDALRSKVDRLSEKFGEDNGSQGGGVSKGDFDSLQNKVDELNKKVNVLQYQNAIAKNHSVELDPTSTEFSYFDHDMLKLAISIEKLIQRGDGTLVTFKIGNLTSATISNAVFDISYGPREPSGENADISAWLGSLQEAHIKALNSLMPGAWTPVEASLPGIKADALGYVEIKDVEASQILLRKHF